VQLLVDETRFDAFEVEFLAGLVGAGGGRKAGLFVDQAVDADRNKAEEHQLAAVGARRGKRVVDKFAVGEAHDSGFEIDPEFRRFAGDRFVGRGRFGRAGDVV